MPGRLIRLRRQTLGITQSRLAEVVGVSKRTVIRWERGEARPRNSHLLRLAAVLGVDPAELL